MGYKFKAWGLDGSLSSYLDFATWNGNGVQGDTTSIAASVVGDRASLESTNGALALNMKRYAGDAAAGSGNRTELAPSEFSDIHDWVAAGEAGALANDALRQYRVKFAVPSSFPLSFLRSAASQFIVFFQLHQGVDTSPADSAGLNPALQVGVRVDAYGRYRFAVRRNNDPTATVTVQDDSVHLAEIVSWPFRFDEEQDIHVDIKWSYSSQGRCAIYRGRRPIFVEASGANCPNNAPSRGGYGMYPKIGIYTSADLDMIVRHRGLIVGDHEATFADMYPELTNAGPLERVAGPASSESGD